MLNLHIAPKNYISGFGIISEFGNELKKICKKVLVLSDENIYPKIEIALESMENHSIEYIKENFSGEVTFEDEEKLKKIIEKEKCDGIVGFGGGKILDAVKSAGYEADVKIITVPTNAATCAAWSSHSAMYTEDGISNTYKNIYKNPDLLFMDKKIIFESPVRYIISGIQDTIAKLVETEAFTKGLKEKNTELEIAIFLAKKCYNDMFLYSKKTIDDINNRVYSDAVDRVIENIILTAGLVGGIGGAACRAVAAHAINNGFTVLVNKNNENLHGEVVGFGNIVQLVLDNKNDEEIKKLVDFYKSIGAPSCLKDLGFDKLSEKEWERVINKSLYKGDTMHNLPYEINFDIIKLAIEKADNYGK